MLKAQGKKGFTLVELIVVIVILAILAAIAVPAMTGYIDKAKIDGVKTEAATLLTGLQTLGTEAYSEGYGAAAKPVVGTGGKYTDVPAVAAAVGTLVDTSYASSLTAVTYSVKGKVLTVTYKGATYSIVSGVGVWDFTGVTL
jgi:prepilin-type N-terminal cleavage/methylation domain-containing protein